MLFWIVYSILAFIVIFSIIIYLKLVYPQKRTYDTFRAQGITGEPYIPLVGQLLDMNRANKKDMGLDYFEELPQKHGYCFLFGFGPLTRLILVEASLIADFLSRAKALNYRKPIDLVNIIKPIIGLQNLLISEGYEHERSRKMLNPAFHFINLRSMVTIMSNETIKNIEHLLTTSSSSSDQINVEHQLNSLTLSIIASSAFGQSFENIPEAKQIMCQTFSEVKDIVTYRTFRMVNQVKFLSELPFWGKPVMDEGLKKVNTFIDQTIVDRQTGQSRSLCSGQDILDLLLSAVDEQGESFSNQQIRQEALTFVLAGHDTTGNLMSWALYVLMTHDDVLQACREEVDRILPDNTIPTFEHLADLHVIEAVLHETLRLYPPVPFFARQCIKEHTISSDNGQYEIHVPVDAIIVVQTHVLHRLEKYWPHPLEFDYKRWMRNPVTGLKPKLVHPFAYLPFGGGPRNCIGQNFALLEAKIILALFVQRCDFKLIPGQRIVREMNGITMRAKYGMFASFTKRQNN